MSGFLGKAKNITGIGLDQDQLYARAFEKGVNLGPSNFVAAADIFDKAARKYAEGGNPQRENQASANALLYRYLGTGDPNLIVPLIQRLQSLEQIERIEVQNELQATGPLAQELDCRRVEALIANAQNDIVGSSDLHKEVADKF